MSSGKKVKQRIFGHLNGSFASLSQADVSKTRLL